jgi:alanyl-tRNA synthetase
MSDQAPVTGNPAETTETVGGASANQEHPTETAGNLEERVKAMEAALKKANNEAAKYRKQAESFEQAEQARKEAELSETEKLKAQNEKLARDLQTLQTNELKRAAAAKHGLPPALALRLQGTTAEELEADAEELAKTLPKQTAPKVGATNPGASPAVTSEQVLRETLFNCRPGGLFTGEWAQQHGGGVFEVTKGD